VPIVAVGKGSQFEIYLKTPLVSSFHTQIASESLHFPYLYPLIMFAGDKIREIVRAHASIAPQAQFLTAFLYPKGREARGLNGERAAAREPAHLNRARACTRKYQ